MTLAQGDVFTKITLAVLVFGLVFLVAEVHHLRVAVENVGLTNLGRGDEIEPSLDRPLADLASRVDALAAVMDRSGRVQMEPGAARDSKIVTRPAADRDEIRATVARVPFAVDWDARLESIVTTLQNLDQSPRVRRASLPAPQAGAREFQTGAVLKTIAAVSISVKEKSGFLMMAPEQLLDRYGKPSSFSFGEKNERGQVNWWYEVPSGSWLQFVLYDGRVMRVESHR